LRITVILAMHGIPPADFPRKELAEFFDLAGRIGRAEAQDLRSLEDRYAYLDRKMRNWPRNKKNDPYQAASQELAEKISEASGLEVIVGYNEFCAPSLAEALQSAASGGADKMVVATPMMTRGGEHAEKDIPAAIGEFSKANPNIQIVYAWPFDTRGVARFLADHISRFV